MRTMLLPAGFLVVFALSSAAAAEGPPLSLTVTGYTHNKFTALSDLELGREGELFSQDYYDEQLLNIYPDLKVGDNFKLRSSFLIVNGLVFGRQSGARMNRGAGETSEELSYDGRPRRDRFAGINPAQSFEVRSLYMEYFSPVGLVEVGQIGSQWGMGMLANSGDGPCSEFSDSYFGDQVWRALFATKPGKIFSDAAAADRIIAAMGFDAVKTDEFASWEEGDRAYQALAALRYEDEDEGVQAGFYATRRWQTADDGEALDVWALDFHAKIEQKLGFDLWPRGGGAALTAEAEAALVTGATEMARNTNAPGSAKVQSGGAAARLGLASTGVEGTLEAGAASGDGNPFDGRINNFTFDPDYNVGMILFEEALGWQSAYAAHRLADPDLAGRPPEGTELLPTDGSVTNALYLMPALKVRPITQLSLTGALLFARAASPLVDPYNSFLNGGEKLNYLGGKSDMDLGMEADFAASFEQQAKSITARLSFAYGHFFPGRAFEREDGSRMKGVDEFVCKLALLW